MTFCQTPGDIRQLNAAKNVRKRRQVRCLILIKSQKLHISQKYSIPPKEMPESGTVASLLLYSGLVLAATGLVITAVGLGDKGLRSRELRLLGPGIMLTGVSLVTLRYATTPRPFMTQTNGEIALNFREKNEL